MFTVDYWLSEQKNVANYQNCSVMLVMRLRTHSDSYPNSNINDENYDVDDQNNNGKILFWKYIYLSKDCFFPMTVYFGGFSDTCRK